MTKKHSARGFLISIGDGEASEVFTPLAGLTSKSLKIGTARIDVTTPGIDPTAAIWRATLEDVKSISVSGDATLVDEVPEKTIFALAMTAASEANFEMFIPGVGTFTGAFSFDIDFSGDGFVKFALSMENNGAIAFVAVAQT
jgi:predicted secreted protein